MKTQIDGMEVRIYEAALTQEINRALEAYVKQDLQIEYISYMSENTDQNFADLDKHCGDLVARIGDIRALSLEVKVKASKHLPSFKNEQHQGLLALAEAGVPVYYAYNNFSMENGKQPVSVGLTDYSGCSPAELPGKVPNTEEHLNLKQLVDRLRNGGVTFDASIYTFAVQNISSITALEASQLNTKSLLLIYNRSLSRLMALAEPAAKRFIREFKKQAIKAPSKDSQNFVTSLNLVTTEVGKALLAADRQSQLAALNTANGNQIDHDDPPEGIRNRP